MKKLSCEICGGTELTKQGSFFVCASCGAKYSVEDSRKMLGISPAAELLEIVQNALQAGSFGEAEQYCQKLLESDASDWKAWFFKGKAAGWQSSLSSPRISETLHAFAEAWKYCPAPEQDALCAACQKELQSLLSAWLESRMKTFFPHPDDAALGELRADVMQIQDILRYPPVPIDLALENPENFALILNNGVCTAWEKVYENYCGLDSHPSDGDFVRFVDEGDVLLAVCDLGLMLCGDTEEQAAPNEMKIQLYENMVFIQKKIIAGKSYRLAFIDGKEVCLPNKVLTDEARRSRQHKVDIWNTRAAQLRQINIRKTAEAAEARYQAYWAQHAQEKVELEKKRSELQDRIGQLEQQLADADAAQAPRLETLKKKKARPAPIEIEISAQEQLIRSLEEKRVKCGFRFKEKKAITERLEQIEQPHLAALKQKAPAEIKAYQRQIRAEITALREETRALREEINKLRQQYTAITEELTRSR